MRQNPHVRICGGPGSATTLVYPTLAFDEFIEGLRIEHLIQTLIERGAASGEAARSRQSITVASVRDPFVDPWPCRECSTDVPPELSNT